MVITSARIGRVAAGGVLVLSVFGCADKSTPSSEQVSETVAPLDAPATAPTPSDKASTNAPAQFARSKPALPVTAEKTPAPVDADFQQYAEKIEEQIRSGEPRTIADGMDWEQLFERIAAGTESTEKEKQEFLASLGQQDQALDQQFQQSMQAGGRFNLLRVRETKKGEVRALYRILQGNSGGINYIDMLLVRDAAGNPRVGDLFLFITGEDFSQSIRRGFLAAKASRERGLFDRLTGSESALLTNLPKIGEMNQAAQQGDSAKALEIFRSLPDEVRQDKSVLVTRMRAAQSVSLAEYAAALEELKHAHGDDPSVDLILIDGYFLKQEYDAAQRSIDSLDESLGGDPYLNVMRANVYLTQQDLPKARAAIDQAILQLPDMAEPYVTALTIALRQQQFDEALELMETLNQKFVVNFDLENNPEFSEFLKSPQYQVWLERNPTNDAPVEADSEPAE